jgi:hypothetical protein
MTSKPLAAMTLSVILASLPSIVSGQVVVWERADPWVTQVYRELPGLNISGENMVGSQFWFHAPTPVAGVRFWASQTAGWSEPGLINWRIYLQRTFPSGQLDLEFGPGAQLISGTSATKRTLISSTGEFERYEYVFELPTLLLSPTVFWLALNVQSTNGSGSLLWDYGQWIGDTHVVSTAEGEFADFEDVMHQTTMRYQLVNAG